MDFESECWCKKHTRNRQTPGDRQTEAETDRSTKTNRWTGHSHTDRQTEKTNKDRQTERQTEAQTKREGQQTGRYPPTCPLNQWGAKLSGGLIFRMCGFFPTFRYGKHSRELQPQQTAL